MSFSQITANTLYQFLGKGVQIATVLIATGILTRTLGSAQFGQYRLLLTLMLLFASLSDWGTGFIGTREAAKHPSRQSQIFTSLLFFRLALALLAGLALLLVAFGFLDLPPLPLLLTATLLPLASIRTSCQIIFQARLKMHNLAIAEIVSSLSFLSLLLFVFSFLTLSLSLPLALALLVASAFLTDVTSLFLLFRLKPQIHLKLKIKLPIVQLLFRESLPMGALLVTFSVYNKLDILLLQHFQGPQAVGFYSLAYSIHDNLVMGAAFFMNSVFPLLSRSAANYLGDDIPLAFTNKNGSPEINKTRSQPTINLPTPTLVKGNYRQLSSTFTTSLHLLLLAGFAVAPTFFFLAPLVIFLLGGSEFAPSTRALQILTLATFLAYLNHATGFTLVALGKQSVSLKIALAALTFNLISNYLLIPHFSFLASSVITIFTEALVFALTTYYLTSRLKLPLNLAQLPRTVKLLITSQKKLF